jgi:hypothetical protein
MRVIDVKLGTLSAMVEPRLRYRIRMCDAEVLEETERLWVLRVGDTELDLLVDALLTTPGVREVHTRPLV